MKKKMPSKKLQLSRETLRDLHDPALGKAVGGQITKPPICGSGANTACFATCLCNSTLC
jgi:hypothetical protein